MQPTSVPSAEPSRAWRWPAGILALLFCHMIAMGVVVFVATRDPSFAVEPQAYKRAVAWDSARAEQRASDQLGWSTSIQVSAVMDPIGRRRVTCRLIGGNRLAVRAAVVTLEAFHHARAAERIHAPLEPAADGTYQADLPIRRAGVWEFRVTAQRDADKYFSVSTATVGGGS